MAVASLELSAVVRPQSPKCWDCRYEMPHLAQKCLPPEKVNICKTGEETRGMLVATALGGVVCEALLSIS